MNPAALFLRMLIWASAGSFCQVQAGGGRSDNTSSETALAIERAPAQVKESGFQQLLSNEALKQWRQCGPGRFMLTNGEAIGEGGMGQIGRAHV